MRTVFLSLVLAAGMMLSSCSEKGQKKLLQKKSDKTCEQEIEAENRALTVSDVLENRESYLGKEVELEGEFRGWSGIQGPPPVSKSDWVLEDKTGAIYVHGPYPEGCKPPATGIGKQLTIKGIVKMKEGRAYIQVTE